MSKNKLDATDGIDPVFGRLWTLDFGHFLSPRLTTTTTVRDCNALLALCALMALMALMALCALICLNIYRTGLSRRSRTKTNVAKRPHEISVDIF